MDPYYSFIQAKKDLEKLHNEYATKLRQEYVRFTMEVKNTLNNLDEMIAEKVKQELDVHIPILHQAVKTVNDTVERRLGK